MSRATTVCYYSLIVVKKIKKHQYRAASHHQPASTSVLATEVRCLAALLSHPNIVSFQRREDIVSHVVLVLDPWFGENMRTYVIKHGPLSEIHAQKVITHGTICLENIIMKSLDKLDHVILAGFCYRYKY